MVFIYENYEYDDIYYFCFRYFLYVVSINDNFDDIKEKILLGRSYNTSGFKFNKVDTNKACCMMWKTV